MDFAACKKQNTRQTKHKGGKIMALTITSSAFEDGGLIPTQYTCDGKNISPPLSWTNLPAGTKSLALIADDPDAPVGTWVHWVVFNIPPEKKGLPEKVPTKGVLPDGSLQGLNDFQKFGYGGPCPPGGTHRYFFKLYALDVVLKEEAGLTKMELLDAMEGHILSQAQLMGRYHR